MKLKFIFWSLMMFPLVLFAQVIDGLTVTTNALPADAPLPSNTHDFWKYGIAIVVPLLVGLMKKWIPQIPKWALPVSTPFVGLLIGAVLNWFGILHLSWIDLGEAGAMGVMIRESFNKIVTENVKGEAGAKTTNTP